jgi:hypothetical protein
MKSSPNLSFFPSASHTAKVKLPAHLSQNLFGFKDSLITILPYHPPKDEKQPNLFFSFSFLE